MFNQTFQVPRIVQFAFKYFKYHQISKKYLHKYFTILAIFFEMADLVL